MIMQAFNGWSEGLASALSSLAHAIRRPRRFTLHADAPALLLRPVDPSGKQSVIRLDQGAEGDPGADIRRQTNGSVIEIVVPPAAILERRLDLPGESRPYVGSVVQHQLETLFPWRAADVLHTSHIEDRGGGRLDVTVRATTRSAITSALAAAAACGAREVLVTDGSEAGGIPVAMAAASRGKADATRMIAHYAIVALLLSAAAVLGWTSYVGWSLEADIASLDEAIADRRAVLKRASDARGQAGGGLEAKKRQSVVAVATLEALSAILPDDTYLTELSLDAGRLRISSFSARATELVPLLEGSGKFRNASFSAPMTRLPGRSQDRFSIEAVLAPRVEGTP